MIETYLAQPIGSQKITPLTIVATSPTPTFEDLRSAAAHHRAEGEKIAQAIWEHLPGGTVDQVLRALLERRASLLIVTHRDGH